MEMVAPLTQVVVGKIVLTEQFDTDMDDRVYDHAGMGRTRSPDSSKCLCGMIQQTSKHAQMD